jgi:hypothetical protein
MSKLKLTLDPIKHIYNAKTRAFHITLEHLFGTKFRELGYTIDSPTFGRQDIAVTNPLTGVTVEFSLVSRMRGCCVTFSGYTDDNSLAILLTVWEDISTLRHHYRYDRVTYNN